MLMNQYFYLKIKKKKLKKKFNNFNKIIIKKNNLAIFKQKYKNDKFKFKPFIFFSSKKNKIKFKQTKIILKFSLDQRKFNLWEKIDNWFHIFFFYNDKKYEDYTVFINFIESIKCLKVLYYIFYFKKKWFNSNKLLFEDKKNIKFWIWIFNINSNFTIYYHLAKSSLYKIIKNKNYKYKLFKKNFIKYSLSLTGLKILSYILEENYREKLLNSSRSKWNSALKRLINIYTCIQNNLKKNKYTSYFYFYFYLKLKMTYFSYVIINDLRTTKILYFWLFWYIIFNVSQISFKQINAKFNVFYFNIDNLKCFIKIFKFKRFYFKKKKKKRVKIKKKINAKKFVKNCFELIILIIKEIIDFFSLFIDKYLYNDFKNVLSKSKNYIYPESKTLVNYIKNFFKNK